MAEGKRKAPDLRPARQHYWARGWLAYRKVRALLRSGFKGSVAQCYAHWLAARGGRRVKGSMTLPKPHLLEKYRRGQ